MPLQSNPFATPAAATATATAAAAYNRKHVRAAGVFMVNVAGGLGSGKTALVRAALSRLAGRRRVGVLAAAPPAGSGHTADDEPYADAAAVLHVATGGEPWLTAARVRGGLDRLPLAELDLLLVENLGARGGDCRAPDIGQDATVCVLSVVSGDGASRNDCAGKAIPTLVVFNKIDLLAAMGLNPPCPGRAADGGAGASDVIELSARTGAGVLDLVDWLLARSTAR